MFMLIIGYDSGKHFQLPKIHIFLLKYEKTNIPYLFRSTY